MIVITIADNGIGMEQGTLPKNLDDLAGSEHVGIYNIHRRLVLRYGEAASFKIDSIEGEGTIITLIFPSSLKPGA
jgi:sensor histidine kinase YesM